MKLNALSLVLLISSAALANDVYAANAGKVKLDMRLRYENVSQDNAAKDADALTLRTLLSYSTKSYNSISGYVEFEDSRQVGIDDYNDTNGNGTEYSVIADPETTELDQAYLMYKAHGVSAKLGRQVITMDNHRFVGHVGWRQDKQTFDAFSLGYKKDKLNLNYAYLTKRNRIFGEEKDLDAKDHLLNASYKIDAGKLTAYSYLLEVDEGMDNSLDTYGLRFSGAKKQGNNKWLYSLEYASQSSQTNTTDFDADYMLAELGYVTKGITFKAGYELLGSDDGQYGFSTPLATLHKFNGWADNFLATPAQGLADVYLTIAGKALGGKWSATYHDFSADEATADIDDFGSEIDVVYSRGFTKNISGGVKLAAYSAGDTNTGKVDTDKVWLWMQAKF